MSIIGESWYATCEMPEKTAKAVQEEKDKTFITQLETLPNGNSIIRYRGLTESEKSDRKAQAAARNKFTQQLLGRK